MKTKQIKCYTKRDLGKHTIYYCWRCFFRIIIWKHLTRTIKINQNLWPCNSIWKNISREVQSDLCIHRVFICRLNQPQIKNHRWFNLRIRNQTWRAKTRHLSIGRFWYPRGFLEPNPSGNQGTTVSQRENKPLFPRTWIVSLCITV